MVNKYTKLLSAAILMMFSSLTTFADEPPVAETQASCETNENIIPDKQESNRLSEIRESDFIPEAFLPRFQGGGLDKFSKWVFRAMVFPEVAHKNNIEGYVEVLFTIEADGAISDIEILFSSAQCFSEEVIRVLKKSPRWTPGRNLDGEFVKFSYKMPISFKLRDKREMPLERLHESKSREFPGLNNENNIKDWSSGRYSRRY